MYKMKGFTDFYQRVRKGSRAVKSEISLLLLPTKPGETASLTKKQDTCLTSIM